MWLDVVVLILGVLAFIRGWRKGLLWAVCSLIALLIGVFLALRVSHSLADMLQEHGIFHSPYALPLCFLAVFVLCWLGFRLLVKLIETALEQVLLGWVNRLFGAGLYLLLSLFFISTLLWLGRRAGLLTDALCQTSNTCHWIEPVSPTLIRHAQPYLPLLHTLYEDIESHFDPDPATSSQAQPPQD